MIEMAMALILGLVIGSFLNVCIVRIPERLSIVSPRSRCPKCEHPIAFYDNVPVLSYVVLGGRCRHCKAGISLRYPGVEALTGAVSLLLAMRYGFGAAWGIYLAFSAGVIVLVLIDLDHRILPDVITLNGIWIGLAASLYLAEPSQLAARLYALAGARVESPLLLALGGSLAGALFGGGLLWLVREAFFLLRGIEGMGFGDVKMMAMVGAFLGVPLTLLTILLGSVVGSIIGLALIRLFGKSRNYELPFGTFLGAGAIIAVLYGNEIVRLYVDNFLPPIV
jgi:leader peptidase (prepilin peptidase) / N-methyltransferase